MPVPDSYGSRRYGSRDESPFTTFSNTRSVTRPGFISSNYTSKLSSATLPPRPSFERKLSTDLPTSRYLVGSRTIPSYGTSSLRASASPVRVTTTTSLRREGPTVSDRIKSYDSSHSDREFTSRFLKPRESSLTSSTVSKSNGYVPRDRSGSRELGYTSINSSSISGIGSRERDRNVRANIVTRAASLGPSAVSRACRNGYTASISHQGSTEVTPSSKSIVSSEASSANVSRGVSPPNSNNTPTPQKSTSANHEDAVANEKCSIVESNRNDPTALSIPITTTTTTARAEADTAVGPSARSLDTNDHLGKGGLSLNGNESRGSTRQSVKMVTETDSNGNTMKSDTVSPCGNDSGGKQSVNSDSEHAYCNGYSGEYPFKKLISHTSLAQPKVIFHKIDITPDSNLDQASGSTPTHHDNENEVGECIETNSVNSLNVNHDPLPISTSIMRKYHRRGSGSPSPGQRAVTPKLLPANEFKPITLIGEEESLKNGHHDRSKSTPRPHSPSPVRHIGGKLKRSPSPAQLTTSILPPHQSSSQISAKILTNRKHSGSPGTLGKEESRKSSPSPISSTIITQTHKPRSVPTTASRESSLSRSPSPHPTVPKPPPLLDHIIVNGEYNVGSDMAGPHCSKFANKEGNDRAGTSNSDSSDNVSLENLDF